MPARGLSSNRDGLTTRQIAQPSTGPQSNASTPTGGQTAAQVTTAVNSGISAHVAAGDPHTQYVQEGGTLANVASGIPSNGAFSALTFSSPPTQAECWALRDLCEHLRDAVEQCETVIETLRVHA